jgi:hypothetical protein
VGENLGATAMSVGGLRFEDDKSLPLLNGLILSLLNG